MYGISLDTLRHYDKIGILHPIVDESNGYRYYSLEHLDLLEHILVGKYLEIPLKEMKNVFQQEDINQYASLIEKQEEMIEGKIQQLQRMKKYINQLKKMIREISDFKNSDNFSELLMEDVNFILYYIRLPELIEHFMKLKSELNHYQVENYVPFYRNEAGKIIEIKDCLLFSIHPEEKNLLGGITVTNLEARHCSGQCVKAKFYGTKAELEAYLHKLSSYFQADKEKEVLVNYEFCLLHKNFTDNEYFVEILLFI